MAQQSDDTMRLRELARKAADAEWPDEEPTEIKVVMPEIKEKAGTIEKVGGAVRNVIDGMRGWPQVFALLIIVGGALAAYALYVGK